ncbi:MAG: HDOD domain-containing protein [Nitrospirota bacterium]|nr:HDOD domain-containing protein [Nitrospirota bacterium]MDH5585291.1 HDOD domain-containing protein [Nitrospirota bacterium]MDH5774356.1 HDOD domain-containing protein [Nitrospirota bacterium]
MTKDHPTTGLSLIDTVELEKYFQLLTAQVGTLPSQLEGGLSIGVEVFTLSEGFGLAPAVLQGLWQHSVRTGYIAAHIAFSQQADPNVAWQAFVGGLLHDIGLLIFLTQQPQVFMAVVELAQSRGQELGTIEENLLGTTHAESGSTFLSRWGVHSDLLDIVMFHDQPFHSRHAGFCPLTAVYIANVLEGGGIAQDGDGVVGCEGEAYLLGLGLWDQLPRWQGWMREISPLPV